MSESNIRELYVVLNDAYDILEQKNRHMMGLNSGFSNGGNSVSSGGSGGSECVGSYPVSGYTRSDGTEVSSYIRTCGAAHAGQSDSNSSNNANNENDWDYVNTEDLDEYLDKELLNDYYKYRTPVLEGKVEQNRYIHPDATPEIYNNDKLTVEEILQKTLAQSSIENNNFYSKDYYKIALDLSDNRENIKNDEKITFYKAYNLPKYIDKNIVYKKIAKSSNLNMNNPADMKKIKNTMIVVPKANSPLVREIKVAKITKNMVLEHINDLLNKNVSINTTATYNETKNLFATINKAEINNLHRNNDGSIEFVLVDYYDFEHLDMNRTDEPLAKVFKRINNNALKQQNANVLEPYLLYIPIKLSKEELDKILGNVH